MVGKLLISKQYFSRERFEKNIIKKLIFNILSNDTIMPFGIYYNYLNQGKKMSISKFHTSCRFSGRAKANFNKFKISRMIFKRYSEYGLLNGIKKASW
jgi:ribosomal protein S14